MEISKIIESLKQQCILIDQTIAVLERLSDTGNVTFLAAPAKRRGRKFMDADARKQVSERMRAYWALRRSETETAPHTLKTGGRV